MRDNTYEYEYELIPNYVYGDSIDEGWLFEDCKGKKVGPLSSPVIYGLYLHKYFPSSIILTNHTTGVEKNIKEYEELLKVKTYLLVMKDKFLESESNIVWYYKRSQNEKEVYGPFSGEKMWDWLNGGYFYRQLQITYTNIENENTDLLQFISFETFVKSHIKPIYASTENKRMRWEDDGLIFPVLDNTLAAIIDASLLEPPLSPRELPAQLSPQAIEILYAAILDITSGKVNTIKIDKESSSSNERRKSEEFREDDYMETTKKKIEKLRPNARQLFLDCNPKWNWFYKDKYLTTSYHGPYHGTDMFEWFIRGWLAKDIKISWTEERYAPPVMENFHDLQFYLDNVSEIIKVQVENEYNFEK